MQKNGVEKVYDEMLLPALIHAKENHNRGVMTQEDEEYILNTTCQMLDDAVFPEQDAVNVKQAPPDQPEGKRRLLRLGCPVRDSTDETALLMLQRLLPTGKCRVEVISNAALAGEVLARVGETDAAVVVIGAVAPYSFASVRYLCKRLRAQFADVKILAGCWGVREDVKQAIDSLKSAGADLASADLLETRDLLLPLIREAALTRAAQQKAADPIPT